MTNNKLLVSASESGQRLDLFCVANLPDHSRASLQRAIKTGDITVNGHIVKPRYLIRPDDAIRISQLNQPQHNTPVTKSLTLPILHQDKDIVVINKPPGVVVDEATMAPRYIVHRLDKDTTGVLILAKTTQAHQHLKEQFKKHRAKKEYLALVFGLPKASAGRITRPITRSKRNPMRRTIVPKKIQTLLTGKLAITEWRLEKAFSTKYALLRVFPLTGRTHQIRVHLHHLGYPIVGDALYIFKRQKSPPGVTRQLLHAEKLTLTLPSKNKQTFTAPLPDDFQSVLDSL